MELTYAHILIVQLCGSISEVAQPAQLTVLPSSVVFTAHANDCVEQIDVTASIGVAEAFTVLQGRTEMYAECLQQQSNSTLHAWIK